MAPMLLLFANTSAILRALYELWSLIIRPKRLMLPLPQLMIVSGRRSVVSSAAARVMTLNTDPGSNGTEVAWFILGSRSAAELMG